MRSCFACHFSIVYRWFKYLSPDPLLRYTMKAAMAFTMPLAASNL